jgi:hypothetical protein
MKSTFDFHKYKHELVLEIELKNVRGSKISNNPMKFQNSSNTSLKFRNMQILNEIVKRQSNTPSSVNSVCFDDLNVNIVCGNYRSNSTPPRLIWVDSHFIWGIWPKFVTHIIQQSYFHLLYMRVLFITLMVFSSPLFSFPTWWTVKLLLQR